MHYTNRLFTYLASTFKNNNVKPYNRFSLSLHVLLSIIMYSNQQAYKLTYPTQRVIDDHKTICPSCTKNVSYNSVKYSGSSN